MRGRTLRTILRWSLPGLLGLNGLVMMAVPAQWYPTVPGVILTGPYNGHFIRDIGAAYLATAAGLGWWAIDRRTGLAGAFVAAVFLDLHAAIHLITPFIPGCGGRPIHDLVRDFAGVFVPAIAASLIVWRGFKPRES